MSLNERIKMATTALRERFVAIAGPHVDPPSDEIWDSYARTVIAAAFPELSGDKPGWIAPWEPTKEMWAAGRVVDGYMLHSVGSVWDAMRDAYLGKGDGG